MAMIEIGKKLPKYGQNKLAIGDLITAWEKSLEDPETKISLQEYIEILKRFDEHSLQRIREIIMKPGITMAEYLKHREYYDAKMQRLYENPEVCPHCKKGWWEEKN